MKGLSRPKAPLGGEMERSQGANLIRRVIGAEVCVDTKDGAVSDRSDSKEARCP